MARLGFFGAVAIAAAALAAPSAPAQQNASNPVDWSKRVAMTAEGGYLMGNPSAPVKVVEYGSLTCPSCARFSESAKGLLASRVRSGKVSFEFRNYVLNGIDLTASIVARCGKPASFFPLVEKLYATQPDWVGRISGLPSAEKDKLRALPDGERLGRLAEIGGIDALAAQHGIAPAQAKKCLADPAALSRLGQMAEQANALGVDSTPTFFVNGEKVHAHDWAELEALIRQAGG